MTTPDKTINVTSLGNLAQILPYLLGHYPDDSICFHAPGTNFHDGPTMTYPLPENTTEWQTAAKTAARRFVAQTQAHDLDQGVIIYLCREPRPGQTPWDTAALLAPLGTWLTDELTDHRAHVLQTIGLVANRWWAYECNSDGCCEGEPLPSPDDPASVAAQMARLGRTPGPRTRDIIKQFQPATPDSDFLKHLQAASDRFNTQCATQAGRDATLMTTCDQIGAALSQFRGGATTLDRDLTTQLIVGLQDDGAVEAGMTHAEDDDLPHARHLWAYLARHCAEPFTHEAVPPLALFAFVAWRQGDLIGARLALRGAITTEPDYDPAIGIHLGIIDSEDPREFLASAREGHAQRMVELQHVSQVASEYRPTEANAARYREALKATAAQHLAQTRTEEGQLLTRHDTIDAIGEALTGLRNGQPQLTDQVAARIIVGLQDRQTRDAALSTGAENDLPYERQLWSYLAQQCVPPHTSKAPPLLTLLAWVLWRQGDAASATQALTDALDITPRYTLAGLLLHGIRTECDPAPILAMFRKESAQFAASRADRDTP
ncbi:DUF4192 domain-containing protein [Streptomyces nigrescens]|uniref:DUF4192 domain-containing protein n=1 Tax=Streptomyces nigrescens TaxID=1920 RepID=UPI0036A15EDB